MTKVFIDGQEGTTGLKIFDRFKNRSDIELLTIDSALRKDAAERQKLINSSDITFLCLPDKAAIEAVQMDIDDHVRIIDTSTAHRTSPGWSYGFPELSDEFREKISLGKRIAVPGCHASGFNALVYPLIKCGLLPKDYPLVCYSVTGYSGGGKSKISEYESENRDIALDSPRQYGLTQNHKHLKEMVHVSCLESAPIFSPILADYYSGMVVTVPLHTRLLNKSISAKGMFDIYNEHYSNQKLIQILDFNEQNSFLNGNDMTGKDSMKIFVGGNDDRIIVSALYDNLGKGASGAAIQCMNIMLGIDETKGLII